MTNLDEVLLVTRRNRETGTQVELWRGLDGAPYAIVCVPHAYVSNFEHRYGPTGAEGFLSHPASEGWCEACSGAERFDHLGDCSEVEA